MKTLLFLLGACFIVVSLSCGSTKGVLDAKHTTIEKNEELEAGEYYQYEIVVEDRMNAIGINGEWRVSGGDRKAQLFVMDEENFLKFKEDHAYKTQFSSGEKTNDNFKIRLAKQYKAKKTLYYLIFENTSDDDKKIELKLELDYEWGEGSRDE